MNDLPEKLKRTLQEDHTEEAIKARVRSATEHSYMGDFILGAVDGTITTLAVVAGVAGAGLPGLIALALGLANVLADGFSMAIGNFLKARSDHEFVAHARRIEELHIDMVPEGERNEIRRIFSDKGFEGETLEAIVEVITQDHKRWVDTMLVEELGLQLDLPAPWRAGISTFGAFVLAGLVPLLPLAWSSVLEERTTFALCGVAAAVVFFLIGWWKGKVFHQSPIYAGLETLGIGGSAAALAWFVGRAFKGLLEL